MGVPNRKSEGTRSRRSVMAIRTPKEAWYLAVAASDLLEALQECADDLEAQVEDQYKHTKDYPSMRRRYDRDIAPVIKARTAIAKAKGEVL